MCVWCVWREDVSCVRVVGVHQEGVWGLVGANSIVTASGWVDAGVAARLGNWVVTRDEVKVHVGNIQITCSSTARACSRPDYPRHQSPRPEQRR